MSWLSSFWKSEAKKVILKAALSILKALAHDFGEQVWGVVRSEVAHVNNTPGLTNRQKYERVFAAVKEAFPGIRDHVANLAIELGVAYLKESLIKK